jgi:phosphinothricin acetyltransferase
MTSARTIRAATSADAARICTIYNHYIATTTISFEEEPVTPAEMARRIADVGAANLPWLVMHEDDKLIAYAYATKWRVRAAYRFAVESSVYLAPGHAGKGGHEALRSPARRPAPTRPAPGHRRHRPAK